MTTGRINQVSTPFDPGGGSPGRGARAGMGRGRSGLAGGLSLRTVEEGNLAYFAGGSLGLRPPARFTRSPERGCRDWLPNLPLQGAGLQDGAVGFI